jgi:hypothetical protein
MKETTMTDPLLLDQFLPTWDHEISMSQLFRAPPAEVFDAITNLDLFRLPVARVLLEARALPGRLANAAARRHGETVVPEPPTAMRALERQLHHGASRRLVP